MPKFPANSRRSSCQIDFKNALSEDKNACDILKCNQLID